MHARRIIAGESASAIAALVATVTSMLNAESRSLPDERMARAVAAATGMAPRLMVVKCFWNCHNANTATATRVVVAAIVWLRGCSNTCRT
eukprot:scaffold15467_cov109-Isochrysis_galbana.AAC.3